MGPSICIDGDRTTSGGRRAPAAASMGPSICIDGDDRAQVAGVNYILPRIASPDLLPGGDRCLTKFVTASGGGTMSKISTETRRELVKVIQDRYESASLLDKQQILDEFVALTGYHRKHAIRVLGSGSSTDVEQAMTPPRERIYGDAVREALGTLWEA